MALTTHRPRLTLNTDGERHPVENALAGAAVALGLVSVLLAFWNALHVPGAWVGGVGALVGVWAQMISATTAERWVIVFGLGFCMVGFYLNMSHGGLF
jgi:hypothetical protein